MSTLKARFDIDQARRLLNDLFPDVDDICPVTGGEASQAYTFSSAGRQLVLRVNHHASYQRDAWASATFQHTSVPAPLIVQTGEHWSLHWAVSERAGGSMLSTLPLTELAPLVPRMLEILIAIHDTPIAGTAGYGWMTETGDAVHSSWNDFLTGDGTYGGLVDWERAMSQAPAHQRDLIEESWTIAGKLMDHGPEERVLNHGDYSLANMLADGDRITGVVDWSYINGDPVWDVAWADFWAPDLGFAAEYFQAKPTDGFDQRLMCYQLLSAAQSLGFYIHTGQPAKGRWLEGPLARLLRSARAYR